MDPHTGVVNIFWCYCAITQSSWTVFVRQRQVTSEQIKETFMSVARYVIRQSTINPLNRLICGIIEIDIILLLARIFFERSLLTSDSVSLKFYRIGLP